MLAKHALTHVFGQTSGRYFPTLLEIRDPQEPTLSQPTPASPHQSACRRGSDGWQPNAQQQVILSDLREGANVKGVGPAGSGKTAVQEGWASDVVATERDAAELAEG